MLDNAYIRPQMSGLGVRSVTAATIAGCHDLSEFECGVIAGTREVGHSISEVAMRWVFSRTTISQVNIGNPVQHQIPDITAAGKRSCKNCGTDD